MADTDLCFLSAAEMSSRLAKGDLSPVELVESHLVHIEENNDRVKAFIHVCPEDALTSAGEAERRIRKGDRIGPLDGIPVAFKDIYDVKGLPTTGGSKVLKGYVAENDSDMAANLRRSGTVCLGKLNTWEFASGGMDVFGDARNPWNTQMVTGGSSSGSGAAVAAGLVPLATGSDTGGSVRIPAAYCGIVGLKPTSGRLSCRGIIPLSWTLDHPGPMARQVRDTAIFFYAMAGEPVPDPDDALVHADFRKLRVGMPKNFFFEKADPEVVDAVKKAAQQLDSMGAALSEVELPFCEYGPAASFTIAYTEAFVFHRQNFFERPADYTPEFIDKISAAAFVTAEEYMTAQWVRRVIIRSFGSALAAVDLILTPTMAYPAHPIGTVSPQSIMRSLNRPVSLSGLPALSVPCGFTQAGLPIGMQLIGRAETEPMLLGVGGAYESTTDWHKRRPSLQEGPVWKPSPPDEPKTRGIDLQWVLDMANQLGLTYVNARMAGAIVGHISPVKAILGEAGERLRGQELNNPWSGFVS